MGPLRLLLDTHALLWWVRQHELLSAVVLAALRDEANSILVSAATGWEIATKNRTGKLALEFPIEELEAHIEAEDFGVLPVSLAQAIAAGSYAAAHRDPFDRLLAAQAELDDLTLVTRDPAFAAFPCRTLW